MRYRPEIDGLRAVAVLPVMLFHAGLGPFPGGFVGVDVFFVISGYLITSKILHERATTGFSLVAFYEGRARRLLPALFVVMAACCPPAYLWMLPGDLERFGKSLIATSLFANNLYLLQTANYWAAASEFKPLLHTWSLAVEEQYYLLFPLVLLLVWRFARRRSALLFLAAAVASLAFAEWLGIRHFVAVFYLLPTRMWELLVGTLAALHWQDDRRSSGATAIDQALGLIGLIMIAAACVLFSIRGVNPSLRTLIPVGGAALVILHARSGTLAFRLLAFRPLVGIGLISYSLYLWHHPLLAFARIHSADPVEPLVMGALLAASFPIAYASWAFVERPFRSKTFVGRRFVFAASVILSAAFLAYGAFLVKTRGLPGRMSPDDVATLDSIYIDYNERAFAFRKTAFERPGALHVLVVGNSFARDFVNMTVETFDLAAVELAYRDDLPDCIASWGTRGAAILEGADIVVLANRGFDPACLGENVDWAMRSGKTLFYAGTKHFGANLNWIMQLDSAERRHRFNRLPPDVIRQEKRMSETIPKAQYLSLLAQVAKDGKVPITDEDGRLLTPDRTHVTRYGALYFGARALRDSAFGEAIRNGRR